MFLIIVTVIFVIGTVSSDRNDPDPGLNLEACDVGDVIENECSKCLCTARHIYDCTSKGCPETNNDSNETQSNIKNRSCHPHKIYNLDGTICICNPDGRWPHESCHSMFRSLPATNTVKQKCIPNSYVVIDCNICRCNDNGQIDDQRCTKNECDDQTKADHRRNSKSGKVYGKCRAKNWYSFAPCQFCYCLNNNKLMCNTGVVNRNSVKLGSYNFSVCGTDLLKEALELTPNGKETANILSKDTKIPEPIKEETTDKAVEKSDMNGIVLEMGANNKNNDDDGDKDKKEYLRIKTTKSQIESEESQEISDSEAGSDNGKEKFTQQPYEESGNRERDTDNDGGRTEDHDDKDDENHSDSGSEDSIPIKPIAREPPESILNKPIEENESQGSISIKFDMKKSQREPTQKERKPSEVAQTKDDEEEQTLNFDFGKAIKNNLPMMFSKVLNNLRKTVSLESESDCEPGTRLNVGCNVCHCLKNKKMICTNKKCQ